MSATRSQIEGLLHPDIVVMVGASARENRIGGIIPIALRRFGFAGTVVPVNPTHPEIAGWPTVADVADVPVNTSGDRAVAFINRPAEETLRHIRDLADRQYRNFVVLSSGFAEIGSDGPRRQHELQVEAQERGLVVVGPNCPGLASFANNLVAMGTTNFRRLESVRSGGVAVVSASGGLGNTIFSYLQHRGIGCHSLIGVGNEAVTTATDFLEYYAHDPTCDMVLLYVEQVRDLDRFSRAVRDLRRAGKHVVAVKAGRRPAGAAALRTHTGAMAGNGDIARDVLLELGVVVVDDPEELADVAMLLRVGAIGHRLGVLSLPGGGKSLLSDAAEEEGLTLPALSEQLAERLRTIVPRLGAIENPLDPSAELSDPEQMADVLEILARSGEFDTVVFFPLNSDPTLAERIARAVADRHTAGAFPVPVLVIWTATTILEPGAWTILREHGVALFTSIGTGFRAIARIRRALTREAETTVAATVGRQNRGLREVLARDPMEALRVVGFTIPERQTVTWADRCEAGWRHGWPVVVKASHPELAHRAKAGGVRAGVAGEAALATAIDEIQRSVKATRGLLVEEFEIQRQYGPGIEWVLATVVDPEIGRVVSIGCGGILVEVIGDVVYGRPTLDCELLLRRVRATKLGGSLIDSGMLTGAALDALLAAFRRLNELALWLDDEGINGSVEINPVILDLPAGTAVAVDALWIGGEYV